MPNRLTTPPARAPDPEAHIRIDAVLRDVGGRTVRSGFIQLAAQGLELTLFVGSGMLLARLLTPADFGVFAMVTSLTAFVSTFKDWGLSMAAVHEHDLDHDQVSALFWLSLRLSIAITAFVALMAPVLTWFYGDDRLTAVTLVMAASFLASGVTILHEGLLIRQMRFGTLKTLELASTVVGVAAGLIAAFLGAGYWALVIQFLAAAVARSGGLWLACGWRPLRAPAARSHHARIAGLVSFGRHFTGYRILTHMGRHIDRVLVAFFGGAAVAGLYDNANRWAFYPVKQVFAPVMNVAVSGLSRFQHRPAAYRAAFRRGLLPLFTVVLPGLAFVFAEAHAVILLLLGDQWLAAVPIFRVMCVAALGASLERVTKWIYLSHGETRRQFRWGLAYGPLMVLAVVAGVPWGALGIAIGYTAGTWLLLLPGLFISVRAAHVRVRDVLEPVARPAAAAAVGIGALALLPDAQNVAGLARSFLVFVVTASAAWLALPGGRDAARSLVTMMRELRGWNGTEEAR